MIVKTPIQLYKYLLRAVKKIPPNAQPYYRHHIKQGFRSHSDETDKERIDMIIQRALEDTNWVLQKKKLKSDDNSSKMFSAESQVYKKNKRYSILASADSVNRLVFEKERQWDSAYSKYAFG